MSERVGFWPTNQLAARRPARSLGPTLERCCSRSPLALGAFAQRGGATRPAPERRRLPCSEESASRGRTGTTSARLGPALETHIVPCILSRQKRQSREQGWLKAHNGLLLRRASQFGVRRCFCRTAFRLWLVTGDLSSSMTLGVLPLLRFRCSMTQSMLSGNWPATAASSVHCWCWVLCPARRAGVLLLGLSGESVTDLAA